MLMTRFGTMNGGHTTAPYSRDIQLLRTCAKGHHSNEPAANHALTLNMGPSSGAAQFQVRHYQVRCDSTVAVIASIFVNDMRKR